jgi:hypothetical protein
MPSFLLVAGLWSVSESIGHELFAVKYELSFCKCEMDAK